MSEQFQSPSSGKQERDPARVAQKSNDIILGLARRAYKQLNKKPDFSVLPNAGKMDAVTLRLPKRALGSWEAAAIAVLENEELPADGQEDRQ